MQLFNTDPSFLVEANAVNHLDKSFSYDEKEEKIVDGHLVKVRTGNRREVQKHVIQAIGTDVNGASFFAYFLPVRDYKPDFSHFVSGQYRFAVQRVISDDNGGVVCFFSGFEPVTLRK